VFFTADFTFAEGVEVTEFGVFHKTSPTYLLWREVQNKIPMVATGVLRVRIHLQAKRS
jgi:hypothetical protein